LIGRSQRIVYAISARLRRGVAHVPEPFGKRNRRAEVKPASKPGSTRTRHAQSSTNPKLYLYAAGAVLFLILAGYAFAQ
jgi:hypothetical protein